MSRLYINKIVSDGKETKRRRAEEQLKIQVTYGSKQEPKLLPEIEIVYWKNDVLTPRIYVGGKLVYGVEES